MPELSLYSLQKQIDRLTKRLCCRTAVLAEYTTEERDALTSPDEGMLIYNTTTKKLNFYNGTDWEAVTSS